MNHEEENNTWIFVLSVDYGEHIPFEHFEDMCWEESGPAAGGTDLQRLIEC